MSCEQSLNIIRGDTFSYACHYDDPLDKPIDLSITEFEALIETLSQSWTGPLTVLKLDQVTNKGDFLISAMNTNDWPVGELQIRLVRVVSGIRSTVLIPVKVIRG
ncbi:hypothetical protein [Acinetobacter bereziniae]|uniref:hypothetical protein n=1 Tax=Acinetobacter bereziniae TaxID=106648 RepID=UPI00124FA648|nr:hypothetical protein [Acinetobacter bereziniae]